MLYENRPKEEDLLDPTKKVERTIIVEEHFPKTIKKGTSILSKYPYPSYSIIKEFYALRRLGKPIVVGATSGHWRGEPFLLYTTDDIEITQADENFIQNCKFKILL